ncbi:uncharacterized protein [Fopius arisanus]|uniref:Uncharacterized protein n=1 Tax=Fopius arisanus TaxID=64838 RepID=A0A9R1T436_9HYME|nr:PREDICTED: uncharacterized protein LOC105266113 [Fopius arisanus]
MAEGSPMAAVSPVSPSPPESGDTSSSTFTSELSLGDEITRELQYWIPIPVFEKFLIDLIPNLEELVRIISPGKTLCEHLKGILEEIKCEELNDNPEMVLVHRVINHEFILRLLEITPRFTWKNMGKMVQTIVERKNYIGCRL